MVDGDELGEMPFMLCNHEHDVTVTVLQAGGVLLARVC